MHNGRVKVAIICIHLVVSIAQVEVNDKEATALAEEKFSIKVVPNPDCTPPVCANRSSVLFYDVVITSAEKILHILLPGEETLRPVSILMIEAGLHAKLKVNWARLNEKLNGTNWHDTVSLAEPTSSYGVVFNQFCHYYDMTDSVVMDSYKLIHGCSHLFVKNLPIKLTLPHNPDSISFVYTASNTTEADSVFDSNSKIKINITIPRTFMSNFKDFSLTPGRGLTFEVTLEHLKLPKPARIALILLPFSKNWLQDNEDYVETMSISKSDDAMFQNIHLAKIDNLGGFTRSSANTPAFLQWRSVCSVSLDGTQRRQVHAGSRILVAKHASKKYIHALPYLFYGDKFNQKHGGSQDNLVGMRVQPIFLGTSGDGFYEKTNFTKFQGILSMDEPDESLIDGGVAKLVAIAITVPLFLILVLITIFATQRFKQNHNASVIAEDESAPLLDVGGDANKRAIRFVLPCRGRLRFWNRIPSPNLSTRLEQESGL